MANDVSALLAGLSALAAWCAVFLAYRSSEISRRALRLAQQQERRRYPTLSPYLVEGYFQTAEDGAAWHYAFLISVSNPTDSDNSISQLDLRVNYRTTTGFLAALVVPVSSTPETGKEARGYTGLRVPISVPAHQTVAGWASFRLRRDLLENCNIETYSLLATDSHGDQTALDITIVREIIDEAETQSS